MSKDSSTCSTFLHALNKKKPAPMKEQANNDAFRDIKTQEFVSVIGRKDNQFV